MLSGTDCSITISIKLGHMLYYYYSYNNISNTIFNIGFFLLFLQMTLLLENPKKRDKFVSILYHYHHLTLLDSFHYTSPVAPSFCVF
jgi:hypothetical protein